jgi:hypothetical protein
LFVHPQLLIFSSLDFVQAEGLFERMQAEGVAADVIGCNALISACSKGQEACE